MSTYIIEGSHQLEGSVKPSGSKDSAVILISAALLSNEDIVLENVPRNSDIDVIFEIIKVMGGTISWIGDNKLNINGSTISTHIIPQDPGASTRYAALLVGPLLFRFGKAVLPKAIKTPNKLQPINRYIDTWKSLGNEVESDNEAVQVESKEPYGTNFSFKISTHMGTANAIITSAFTTGQTIINNAAEESELDDLIEFINVIGGEVERVEPRKIRVIGRNVFKKGYFEVQPDAIETVAYATAALVTKGNIVIEGIKKLQLTSFVNFLTNIGARFEYNREELSVWYGGEEFKSLRLESAPAPGFLADWLPFAALILCYSHGKSIINDSVYVDRYGFVPDLNRMGANIVVKKPSEVGFKCIISDESYDYETLGEPGSSIEITGPAKLRGTRLSMNDDRFDAALIIGSLGAEGKSELIGIEDMSIRYENFFEKLSDLGASIISA